MTREIKHALVVDDETQVRSLTVGSLAEYGFECDEAGDGAQAWDMVCSRTYDVVVTDLKMPQRHGHSLAVDIIEQLSDRPLLIVLTGVAEPRLAEDLFARGVDDIAFKPIAYKLFGAKVRAMCDRRSHPRDQEHSTLTGAPLSKEPDHVSVTIEQVEEHFTRLAGTLPVSQFALEVIALLRDGVPSSGQVARCIARDPLLTMDVLRMASSPQVSSGGSRIETLEDAVLRIGDRRISDLASVATTVQAPAAANLQWINVDLIRRRCLASSLACQKLNARAALGQDDEGLFLAALFLPMSRLLMGIAFADLYQDLLANSAREECSLASQERAVLSVTPPAAMAGLLSRWKVSPRLYKPLRHAGDSYHEIMTLTEPLRTNVERLRLSQLLGELAVGSFQSWDEIAIPLAETLRRFRTADLSQIVSQVRIELTQHFGNSTERHPASPTGPLDAWPNPSAVRYHKLTADTHDLLTLLMEALNLRPNRISRDAACLPQSALVNCLGVSPERFAWFLDDAVPDSQRAIVCSDPLPAHCQSWGPVIQLPCRFDAIAAAFRAVVGDSTKLSSGRT